ncbi:MAG: hypothetical protein IT442_02290 [Phycisphaeraceae bacterium]|nr:hypothetical protein [Phycisphaeraceae bacterium]
MARLTKRHWLRRTVIVLLILIVGWMWYCLPLGPFLEDGPFHGIPVAPITSGQPDQSMPIFNGLTIEVFNSSVEGVSPVVQLRQRDGSIRWSIRADGHQLGDVHSIRFEEYHRGLTRSGVLRGMVHWTYGHEKMTWFITGGGNLRDYWYSW